MKGSLLSDTLAGFGIIVKAGVIVHAMCAAAIGLVHYEKGNDTVVGACRCKDKFVALVFYTEEQSTAIRDHTIYTNRCVYPIVTIEGNESAAAKINADIQKRVDAYQASANTFSYLF